MLSYKTRFISNSRSCTTTNISIILTSCLAKSKYHVDLYFDKAYQKSDINLFWSIKNSTEVLGKLQNIRYLASTLSTYDFSILYMTLPHNLIKKTYLIDSENFAREKILFWLVMPIVLPLLMSKRSITNSGLVPKFVSHSAFFLINFCTLWGFYISSDNGNPYGY